MLNWTNLSKVIIVVQEGVLGLNIRKCTVVAQTPVELLSLTKEDGMILKTGKENYVQKGRKAFSIV